MNEPIVLESNQVHATITENGICPTLSASMGLGGGYVPMVCSYGVVTKGNGECFITKERHLLYQDAIGALCATDYKWVQQEQVEQGKLIIYEDIHNE